ncbi:hypothetical protein DPX16_12805 [Anabarilius grahami]|uniref:Uncharacterized protein n=1 Tax=Anabarilius grahami TaxID=495550 RepID=A0A3N0Z906_ANAGA|nr:hypothetical protein DPX16_12805 [Anabarilius grahami]
MNTGLVGTLHFCYKSSSRAHDRWRITLRSTWTLHIVQTYFFCEGVNQPLKSQLIREGPRSSISHFLDYALLTVGSPFTVGVAEERDTSSGRVMAAAPKDIHKMPSITTTTPVHVSADHHEQSQVTINLRESSHVSADLPEQRHFSVDLPEPSHVSADRPEPRHVSADHPEPRYVSADRPESRHVSADRPELRHADRPEQRHASADRPEQRHVAADRPESHHVSRSVRERRGLRSSVADPPLTSARAAGIPKPPPVASLSSPPATSHSSPPAASLSSPSAASLSSPPAASLSSQPATTHSSSPVATHSSSPIATHSSSPVATHSVSLDAMDKMAASPVPTGKMAAPSVSVDTGVVPAVSPLQSPNC